MTENLYASGTVAQMLGISRWQLLYRIERGDVPGPSSHVPGRRLFTDEDVERIARALHELDGDQQATAKENLEARTQERRIESRPRG